MLESAPQSCHESGSQFGSDLDIVLAFDMKTAGVRAVPVHGDDNSGRSSIWMWASPLPDHLWINRRIFHHFGRQFSEFGYEDAANNVFRPMDVREGLDQITVRWMLLFHKYESSWLGIRHLR